MKFTDKEIQKLIENGEPLRSVFGDVYFDSLVAGSHEQDITGAWVYHESVHELFLCANEDLLDQ